MAFVFIPINVKIFNLVGLNDCFVRLNILITNINLTATKYIYKCTNSILQIIKYNIKLFVKDIFKSLFFSNKICSCRAIA